MEKAFLMVLLIIKLLIIWYTSGLILFSLALYMDHLKGKDLTVADLEILMVLSFLGPFNILPIYFRIRGTEGERIVFKGRPQCPYGKGTKKKRKVK